MVSEGYERAKAEVLAFLDTQRVPHSGLVALGVESKATVAESDTKAAYVPNEQLDKELLQCVARTTLRTKLPLALADQLAEIW